MSSLGINPTRYAAIVSPKWGKLAIFMPNLGLQKYDWRRIAAQDRARNAPWKMMAQADLAWASPLFRLAMNAVRRAPRWNGKGGVDDFAVCVTDAMKRLLGFILNTFRMRVLLPARKHE